MAAPFNPKACLRVRAIAEQIADKEFKDRRKWFRNNYERVYLNPSLPEDKIPKRAAVFFNELLQLEKAAAEMAEQKKHKKKVVEQPVEEEEQLSVAELLARGPMYPVPEEVKNVLYNGISHNDEGRRHYLKLRNGKDLTLEEKFYQPMSVSQEYGWQVQERYIPAVRYGRRSIIKQSFMRRNGVLKFNSHLRREPQSKSVAGYLIQ